jgi:hypothetical protein
MNNNQIRAERQEVVNLIKHFKGQGMSFRTIAPIINELGFKSVTGLVFDPSVLNKIFKNQRSYLDYKDNRVSSYDPNIENVPVSKPNIKFKVARYGDYVIRNEQLKEVLFRSKSCQETFEKYKELQTM